MPERSSIPKRSLDTGRQSARIVDESPDAVPPSSDPLAPQKNPHAAALGKLGGQKGGPARAMKLSAERRREIAQKAAQARWHGGQEKR